MSTESSGKPDAWKLARPVWGWGRGETPRPTPRRCPDFAPQLQEFLVEATCGGVSGIVWRAGVWVVPTVGGNAGTTIN
jgi:hypothetical protein